MFLSFWFWSRFVLVSLSWFFVVFVWFLIARQSVDVDGVVPTTVVRLRLYGRRCVATIVFLLFGPLHIIGNQNIENAISSAGSPVAIIPFFCWSREILSEFFIIAACWQHLVPQKNASVVDSCKTLSNSTETISIRQSHIISKHPVCNIIGFICRNKQILWYFFLVSFLLRSFQSFLSLFFKWNKFSFSNWSSWATDRAQRTHNQKEMSGGMSILRVRRWARNRMFDFVWIIENHGNITDALLFEIKVYAHTHTLFSATSFFLPLFVSVVGFRAATLFAIAVSCHSIMSIAFFVFFFFLVSIK